jgi:CRISPR-associated protein Csd1
VFPVLLRNAQHHISKAEYGRATDSLIEEVVQDLSDFPAHLDLQQQGLFAMGYYHQRNENYRKKSRKEAA